MSIKSNFIRPHTIEQDRLALRTLGSGVGNISYSVSTGAASNGSGSPQTYASAALTTSGRPVFVGCVSDGSGVPSYFGVLTAGAMYIILYRDGIEISRVYNNASAAPPGIAWVLDEVGAGSYTYSLHVHNLTNNSLIYYMKLMVYEI
jgi:hypothetical protein